MYQFSPQSKVWIYLADRVFTAEEAEELTTALADFALQWAAHNMQLKAHGEVRHNRFMILMVDETQTTASGCSIDSSVHFIKKIENQLGVSLFNRQLVAYKADGEIHTITLSELANLAAAGGITADTIVFNNLAATKQQLDAEWEIPISQSWMKRYLPAQTPQY